MNADVFVHSDYKKFLNQKLDALNEDGRGSRSKMARSIGCQTAYVAQVLRGNAHFSLEQGELINDFLGHNSEQGHFFLLLIQIARTSSTKLRNRFQQQVQSILEARSFLKNRLGVKQLLNIESQYVYYSSWVYGAIHAFVSIPGFQSAEKISSRLGLALKQTNEYLDFLVTSGLLEKKSSGGLVIGKKQIHLGADSPLIAKHHANWRMQAMRAIERAPESGLHYSSIVSLSQKDAEKIREALIEKIKEVKAVIRDSKEEKVCSFSLDFFEI